ncbi:MAG: hypothetical protein ACYCUM_05900, partial [Solirubrobacteraceae bacterium]
MQLLRHRPPANAGQNDREQEGRRRLRGPLSSSGGRSVAIAGAVIAIGVAPAALAAGSSPSAQAAGNRNRSVLVGGIHNPAHAAYTRTTGIFANAGGFVTRIKNQGSGGSAALECNVRTGGACLFSDNRSTGFSFEFVGHGSTGGTILLANPQGAPFTTNAHGVATGLNANYLQGKQAGEFQLAAQPAAKATEAEKLGGKPASEYLTTGQLLFATVAGEKLQSTRGATGLTHSGSTYTVLFGANVSKCAYTASPEGAALETGSIGVAPAAGNANAVDVILPAKYTGGF